MLATVWRSICRPVLAVGRSIRRADWSTFWPMVTGILIGVPIALGLAHYGLSIQERARQADERARLQRGLTSVAVAVNNNSDRLRQLSDLLRADRTPFDVVLDVSAWDVSKQEIIPFLQDAEMQRRIAHHFTRTESVRRLVALLFEQSVGVASALGSSAQTRKALISYLQAESDDLSREARQLAEDITKLVGR